MIKNREEKIEAVVGVIRGGMKRFNGMYREGPSEYFYHRVLDLRRAHRSIETFVSSDYCLEILYATLVAWDMNSRKARMKDFNLFCASIRGALAELVDVQSAVEAFSYSDPVLLLEALGNAYDRLALMVTSGRLVSNAKTLHFLFPDVAMPMDGTYTLNGLYGNTGESRQKYVEVMRFCFDVLRTIGKVDRHLDDGWNTTPPKLVDNAIIMWQVGGQGKK